METYRFLDEFKVKHTIQIVENNAIEIVEMH